MSIKQADVDRWCALDAQIKKLAAEKNEIGERLLPAFANGEKCPLKGPMLLDVVQQTRKEIAWKEHVTAILQEFLGTNWQKRFLQIENEAPTKIVCYLKPKPNALFLFGK